ncbi:MAG: RecX family transcriptional regulator [Cytophagales bacterium]|nr:RecX family transcriptional regulator [Cytophagales bacterium]
MTNKVKVYNKKQALLKITAWCARREHTKQEARDKLYLFGLQNSQVEEIIDGLVKDDFINEKRFVKAYVNDKFRLNKWGKIKIENGLKLKGISSELINKGLKHIDEKEYLNALAELIDKKKEKEPGAYPMLNKLVRFAISRGFEAELVWEKVKKMEDV